MSAVCLMARKFEAILYHIQMLIWIRLQWVEMEFYAAHAVCATLLMSHPFEYHLNKLLVVDVAVPVNVRLGNQLVRLVQRLPDVQILRIL